MANEHIRRLKRRWGVEPAEDRGSPVRRYRIACGAGIVAEVSVERCLGDTDVWLRFVDSASGEQGLTLLDPEVEWMALSSDGALLLEQTADGRQRAREMRSGDEREGVAVPARGDGAVLLLDLCRAVPELRARGPSRFRSREALEAELTGPPAPAPAVARRRAEAARPSSPQMWRRVVRRASSELDVDPAASVAADRVSRARPLELTLRLPTRAGAQLVGLDARGAVRAVDIDSGAIAKRSAALVLDESTRAELTTAAAGGASVACWRELVLVSSPRLLRAFDARTGRARWQWPVGGATRLVDDRVVVAAVDDAASDEAVLRLGAIDLGEADASSGPPAEQTLLELPLARLRDVVAGGADEADVAAMDVGLAVGLIARAGPSWLLALRLPRRRSLAVVVSPAESVEVALLPARGPLAPSADGRVVAAARADGWVVYDPARPNEPLAAHEKDHDALGQLRDVACELGAARHRARVAALDGRGGVAALWSLAGQRLRRVEATTTTPARLWLGSRGAGLLLGAADGALEHSALDDGESA